MEKLSNFLGWYGFTAKLIGIPVLFVLLFIGFQKFVFTTTCMVAGFRCEYSIGATDAMVQYMGELLESNPNMDIVSRRRK